MKIDLSSIVLSLVNFVNYDNQTLILFMLIQCSYERAPAANCLLGVELYIAFSCCNVTRAIRTLMIINDTKIALP